MLQNDAEPKKSAANGIVATDAARLTATAPQSRRPTYAAIPTTRRRAASCSRDSGVCRAATLGRGGGEPRRIGGHDAVSRALLRFRIVLEHRYGTRFDIAERGVARRGIAVVARAAAPPRARRGSGRKSLGRRARRSDSMVRRDRRSLVRVRARRRGMRRDLYRVHRLRAVAATVAQRPHIIRASPAHVPRKKAARASGSLRKYSPRDYSSSVSV